MKTTLILTAALLAASAASAQITIDQNRALAGNVTPGDAPGFPVTLSAPGSYKLTGNLTVPAETKGIVITGEGVTLDLNGFTIKGPSSCTRDLNTRAVACSYVSVASVGIDASDSDSVEVRNGSIRGFGGVGVVPGRLGHYDHLRITQNSQGVYHTDAGNAGPGNTFANSLFATNQTVGLAMHVGLVINSRAINNGSSGFSAGSSKVLVADSQTMGNRNYGLYAGAARGTQSTDNGTNKAYVNSMGGNLDGGTPY